MAVAIATAAIAAAGALINVRRENSSAMQQLEQFGRHQAAIEYQTADKQAQLVGITASVMESNQQQELIIEQSRQADAAATQVAAAASGTAGQSVDLAQQEVEAAAGRAMGTADKQLQNQLRKINAQSRSINLDADAEILDFEYNDTQGQLAEVFLSGLQGFLGAGGFGT